MNKKVIALVSCATLLLSSTSLAVESRLSNQLVTVDVVATATTTDWKADTPSTPASKPTTGNTTKAPAVVFSGALSDISRLIALNSVGNDVALIQNLLNQSGHSLKVDGIVGNTTLNAIKDFQSKNGLRADGIVGPKTIAKLAPLEVVQPIETEVVEPEVVEPEVEEVEEIEEVEEVEEVDVVTTASIVDNEAAFEKAISKDGAWIACTLKDLTFDKELVLDGEHTHRDALARKIAPYTQETLEDGSKKVIDRFTITAPKLTINSPNAKIQSGTFIGDIFVNAPNFQLVDARVEGNIYFLNNDFKNTFTIDENSSIKGQRVLIVEDIDAVATASIVKDEETFEKAIVTAEEGGTWIAALLKDLTFNKTLTLEGPFENRDTPDRKIGLYNQVTLEDGTKVKTHNFTLTVPQLFIKSPSARMLDGTFNGNLYVFEDEFKLENVKVNGNVYFANESVKTTFNNVNSEITGEQELVEVDAITSATNLVDGETLEKSLSKHGVWIICLKSDITTDKELVMEGEFKNGKFIVDGVNAGTHVSDRKLALYDQDDKRNITAEYTLKAPKLTVKVPNARIENGTFEGDIYISATGVTLNNTKVIGNVYFTNEEAKATFNPKGDFSVTGVQELKVD